MTRSCENVSKELNKKLIKINFLVCVKNFMLKGDFIQI